MDEIILQRIADQITELHLRIRGIRNLLKVSVSDALIAGVLDEPMDRQDPNFQELREIVLRELRGQ